MSQKLHGFVMYNDSMILTLLDGHVRHRQSHGVSGEDIVSAIDVFAIDGQSSSR